MNGIKQKVRGSLLGVVGFMLSPLSWWNDLVVNMPLAVAFAWLVSLFFPAAFGAAVVIGYWLSNLIGLVLLHKGARDLFAGQSASTLRQEFLKDLLISMVYTIVIVALLKWKVLQPLPSYLSGTNRPDP